jgi:hypothetical protein
MAIEAKNGKCQLAKIFYEFRKHENRDNFQPKLFLFLKFQLFLLIKKKRIGIYSYWYRRGEIDGMGCASWT